MPGRSPLADDDLVHRVAALERTALAWERTAFGLAALGALLAKLGVGGPVVRATGLALVATAFGLVGVAVPVGYRRARARVDRADPARPFVVDDPWRPRIIAVTAISLSLTVLVVAAELLRRL